MQASPFRDLTPNSNIETVTLVRSKVLSATKTGKPYLQLTLTDCESRELPAVLWNLPSFAADCLDSLQWVSIQGRITIYKDAPQITLTDFPQAVERPGNFESFLPCSSIPFDELERRFVAHIESVNHPTLNALLSEVFLIDLRFQREFYRFPAATIRHHPCRHGLLQHTIEVADGVAQFMDAAGRWQSVYISRDLAIAGALLHDIGKVFEFEEDSHNYTFGYSLYGKLLGHIALAQQHLLVKINRVRKDSGFPRELETVLQHLVQAHHGRAEWGSPIAPMTPEAAIIHYADKLSSDLYYFAEAQKAAVDSSFYFQRKLEGVAGNTGREVYINVRHLMGDLPETVTIAEPAAKYTVPQLSATLPTVYIYSSETVRRNNFAVRAVPLIGLIAAGEPIADTANSNDEEFLVGLDKLDTQARYYLLRIKGDSMTGDAIYNGDTVLVRHQETAEHNDLVVARIDNTGTVKRLVFNKGEAHLIASNPDYKPIVLQDRDDLRVQGLVVAIARHHNESH